MPSVRLAQVTDLERINAIYNHYVLHSTCTYQETPESMDGRREWFARHGVAHPVTVAEIDGLVVGWASISPSHTRSAWRFTVENSVYVDSEWRRYKIGSALLQDLIARTRALGYRAILASIDGDQAASVGLHAKFGFTPVGRLLQVGFKFGRWLDVVYMELQLPPADADR